QQHAGRHHHDEPALDPRAEPALELGARHARERDAQEPKVPHHREPDKYAQGEHVRRLHERIRVPGLAQSDTARRGRQPLNGRQQRHGVRVLYGHAHRHATRRARAARGCAAFRARPARAAAALEAVNIQLYPSCTSCHQHYRPNHGRRAAPASAPAETAAPAAAAAAAAPAAPALEGRWKLIAAEDLRADGSVARLPWGAHPAGSIVVDRGACYVQIMSTDTPSFAAGGAPPTDQMKTALTSTYIAYSGPCVVDAAAGSVTLKVDAAWRPD